MKVNKCYKRPFFYSLLFVIVCSIFMVACELPDGETEKSHGSDAAPDYKTVFNHSVVKRIDLIFEPEDWQAMLENMEDLLGPFGVDVIPQEAFSACAGNQPYDGCQFMFNEKLENGMCILNPVVGGSDGKLICAAESLQNIFSTLIGSDPIYSPCTVKFKGKTWQHVGMRFKGNSSLLLTWAEGSYKLPFRLDFDKFEDDYPEIENQRFYGFDKLTFASGFLDNSLMREQVVSDVFRDAGVPAAKSAFYRVYIDYGEGPIYFGLYTMIEDPDGPMLNTQFNDDEGNLYKPDGKGATFTMFDQEAFVKKNNEDEADWSDVEALYEALHANRDDEAAWRIGLESVFDVNGFLQYLAINNFVLNWDSYGNYAHNYYLYFDSDIEGLRWIPWDHNMTMLDMPSVSGIDQSPDFAQIGEEWPLIRYLLDDEVYWSRYLFFVNETLNGVFESKRITRRFRRSHNLIRFYVIGRLGEHEGYTLLNEPDDFKRSLQSLIDFAAQRQSISAQFLSDAGYSPSPIVINEIYYHPTDEQGDDYEFIEIVNIGNEVVELSGYKFSGISFSFPTDTAIEPGEYILVCKNSDIYADKASQVFQWNEGKLSNKGERILLLDNDENIVDYIPYNDGFNWPEKADGDGYSLELIDSESVNSMAENWRAVTLGGTPGQASNWITSKLECFLPKRVNGTLFG